MKKFILLIVFVLGLSSTGFAQSTNPCTNADNIQSVAITIASGTTTRIINSTDAEKKTIICGIALTLVGAATANTVVVEYGTGATCGTGLVALTGGHSASTVVGSSTILIIPPFSFKSIPAGNSTCLLTTTADAVKGVVSFVLQ